MAFYVLEHCAGMQKTAQHYGKHGLGAWCMITITIIIIIMILFWYYECGIILI